MDDRITGKKRKWVYQQITIEENQSSETEESSSESDSDYILSSSDTSEELPLLSTGNNDNPLSIKEEVLKEIIGHHESLRQRILNADLDDQRKAIIYEQYETLQKIKNDTVTATDIESWIEEALKTPFTKVKSTVLNTENPTECLLRLKNSFEKHLSHMDRVVEPLLSVINNRLNNS